MNGREHSGWRGGWGTGATGYLQGRHVIRQPNRDGRLHIQYVVVPEKIPQLLLVLVDHLDHSGRGAEASAPSLGHPPRAFPTWASLPSSCFRPLKFTLPRAFQEMGRAGAEGPGLFSLLAPPTSGGRAPPSCPGGVFCASVGGSPPHLQSREADRQSAHRTPPTGPRPGCGWCHGSPRG